VLSRAKIQCPGWQVENNPPAKTRIDAGGNPYQGTTVPRRITSNPALWRLAKSQEMLGFSPDPNGMTEGIQVLTLDLSRASPR
jgi:hypothetical protein